MSLVVLGCIQISVAQPAASKQPDELFTSPTIYPQPTPGDFEITNFHFQDGQTLPSLRIHYQTLGTPVRDSAGVVTNAVLVIHGTGGEGSTLLTPAFAGVLFGEGRLLDAKRYFIVLPDGIGHGKSSKPSDGLRAHFPNYTYDDMVVAHYRLLTEKLGVNHLRLVTGTSMGGMQTWVWGETYPDFMDALMPLASLPVEIAGRNRMSRKMIIDSIRNDPAYENGDYKTQPKEGLTAAANVLLLMGSAPLYWQKLAPTREDAERYLETRIRASVARLDANDMIYQYEASRFYNPSPQLQTIRARLTAINSADDFINPPELGIMEREIKKVPRGKFVLIPISEETRGHGTHSLPAIWQMHLRNLLADTAN